MRLFYASRPCVENNRLMIGRPADARFRVWVSALLIDSEEVDGNVFCVGRKPVYFESQE